MRERAAAAASTTCDEAMNLLALRRRSTVAPELA